MRIEDFNIFGYEETKLLLNSYLSKRQKIDPQFSVRKWSKDLGHNSHSLLSLQLKGKRKIKIQHIDRFASSMSLTEFETRYFKGLTLLEKAQNREEKEYQLCKLLENVPHRLIKTKKYRQFSLISNWLNMAIMALSELKEFQINEQSVFKKLGHRASVLEIQESLSLLQKESLLKKDGENFIPIYEALVTDNDVLDIGIRKYHKEASLLAKEAVDSQGLNQREFQSFCLSISKEKIPIAKELVRKFRDDFCQLVGGSGEDIYKMNIQLFQLSRSAEEKDSSAAREFAHGMPLTEDV